MVKVIACGTWCIERCCAVMQVTTTLHKWLGQQARTDFKVAFKVMN